MDDFDKYDEFGNYIGADLDSDDEEDMQQEHFTRAEPEARPLEGFDDETSPAADEGAGMQVDGTAHILFSVY